MVWKTLYNVVAIPMLAFGFRCAAVFNPKIRAGIIGRRNAIESLSAQLRDARKLPDTVWFHFTSVGEFEQAKPLIEAIKDRVRIVLTYYSPSVQPNVEKYPYRDAAAYLPLDTARSASRLFQLVQPTGLVFSKFDIWPNLVWEAAKRHVPVVLIAGTLHPKSKRLAPLVGSFFREAHRYITVQCVISAEDAERFRRISPPNARIEVTGDTRFDRVYERAKRIERGTPLFFGQETFQHPVLVAGSTYAEEEAVLCEALEQLRTTNSRAIHHLILVPHEPTPTRIDDIRRRLRAKHLSHICLSELREGAQLGNTDVLVIDAVGLLARLYSIGDVAFVGGSFHGSVHNVMEPAALAKPIVFGPIIHNAYEAQVLVARGAALIVKDSVELAAVLERLASNPTLQHQMGLVAEQVIVENLGATERSLAHILPFLSAEHVGPT